MKKQSGNEAESKRTAERMKATRILMVQFVKMKLSRDYYYGISLHAF